MKKGSGTTQKERFKSFVVLLLLLNIMPWAVEYLDISHIIRRTESTPFNLINVCIQSFLILIFTGFYIFLGITKMRDMYARWQVVTGVLKAIPEPVFSEDTEHNIVFMNALCSKLTGWETQDVIEKARCADVLGKGVEYVVQQSMEIGKIIDGAETVVVDRAGKRVTPVRVTAGSVKSAGGELMGGLAIVKDITREKELQAKLQKAEKLVGIGNLASSIAKELNEPLDIIKILSSNLIKLADSGKVLDDEELGESLGMLEKQVERTSKIVDHILEHTRLLAAEPEKTEEININTIIRDSVEIVKPKMTEDEIGIKMELQDRLPAVNVHRGKFQRVFLNILRSRQNAMNKLSQIKDESYKKRLIIRSFAQEEMVNISLSDTGGNIPLDEPALKISFEIIESFGGEFEIGINERSESQLFIKLPAAGKDK